jgi:hypothetical protein
MSEDSDIYNLCLIKRGHPEEVLKHPGGNFAGAALLAMGRLDDALQLQGDEWTHSRALAFLGRAAEVQTQVRDIAVVMEMAQGHGERALALTDGHEDRSEWARSLLALQAWIRGDRAEAETLFSRLPDTPPEVTLGWRYRTFLRSFLRGLSGDRAEFDAVCRDVIANHRYTDEQHAYFEARCLLGEIDDAGFLAQPHCIYAEAVLRRCKGMRAERAGRAAEALAAYHAYLELPAWRRDENIDPVWDTFVQWRVAELQARPPAP